MKMPVIKKPAMKMPVIKVGGKARSRRGPNGVVGLEIEAGSIAATEVKSAGAGSVARTAISSLPPGVFSEGEVVDADALASSLSDLFARNKLGKTVRLGVANQSVVVRTMRLPLIEDRKELETAVRFQAQEQVPMPLDQAVLDFEVIGKSNGADGDRSMEVVTVAARRDMVTAMLGAMRRAGLRPVGIDLSAFGMIRALGAGESGAPATAEGELVPTTAYCSLGDVTNLAVARGSTCLFTRIGSYGIESIAARVAEAESMSLEDAREWMLEVGLEDDLDLFDDDFDRAKRTRKALEEGAAKLADEMRVSLEFYGAQEAVPPVDRVVLCGAGTSIAGMTDRIRDSLRLDAETAIPTALSHLDNEDGARLTVPYGLALEG